MEAVIKIKILDEREEDWGVVQAIGGGFKDLSDADIVLAVAEIIREAIVNNGLYYDVDDAEDATQEILPAISSLVLNPRFSHIRKNYNTLVELVTYLTVQLA